jgi:hypothetical protein
VEAAKRASEASMAAGTHSPVMVVAVAAAAAVVEVVVGAALPGVQAAAAAFTQNQPAVVCRPMPVASAMTRGDNVSGAGRGGGAGISGGGRWPGGAPGPPLISHQAWPAGVPARLVVQAAVVEVVVAAWEVYHAVATSRSACRL